MSYLFISVVNFNQSLKLICDIQPLHAVSVRTNAFAMLTAIALPAAFYRYIN